MIDLHRAVRDQFGYPESYRSQVPVPGKALHLQSDRGPSMIGGGPGWSFQAPLDSSSGRIRANAVGPGAPIPIGDVRGGVGGWPVGARISEQGSLPLDESGAVKVSQRTYDYTRPYWDQSGATIDGHRVFDMTGGWNGKPPGGVDHVVVVTHRGRTEGWDPEAPFHLVEGAAGDVGGQVLAAGLVDEVRMDVVAVVLGSGKRYLGSVHTHLLEDPQEVIRGNRVLHLRYRVRH